MFETGLAERHPLPLQTEAHRNTLLCREFPAPLYMPGPDSAGLSDLGNIT
jgi:hypothetical protein